ncbi:hypothetical protein ACFSCX_13655 [Bacillus salitolerans]|uniref:DUF1294 domain-containing protein n=1 Tax=Bacillus salitolerans TaxID=1437434 RepID=A0ABW4LSU7_9BACI
MNNFKKLLLISSFILFVVISILFVLDFTYFKIDSKMNGIGFLAIMVGPPIGFVFAYVAKTNNKNMRLFLLCSHFALFLITPIYWVLGTLVLGP